MKNAALCAVCLEPNCLGRDHYDGYALLAILVSVLLIADQLAVIALLASAYAMLLVLVTHVTSRPSRPRTVR